MSKTEHTNYNILAFGGRKESGKTELANICVNHGYTKLSFATPLKLLICKLLQLDSIEALNELKNKEIGHVLGDREYQMLSEACGASYEYCMAYTSKLNEHSTGRDWLQIIGTDLIRSWNYDWHAEQTIKMIEPDKKYVIDDIRFPNEMQMLKKINAECWFIIRTKVDNISHHISEESIDYTMFEGNIIVNDGTLEKFRKRWDAYMHTHVESCIFREKILKHLPKFNIGHPNGAFNLYFLYDSFKELSDVQESVDILMATHNCKRTDFNDSFKVYYKNAYCYTETNPFRIETMKKYYKREDI